MNVNFFPTKLGLIVRRDFIEVYMQYGHLFRVDLQPTLTRPAWLENEPREDFQAYAVYLRTYARGDFVVQLGNKHQGLPESVLVMSGAKVYQGASPFRKFKHPSPRIRALILALTDCIYMTIPGTNMIYFQKLKSEITYEERKQIDAYMSEMRAERYPGHISENSP